MRTQRIRDHIYLRFCSNKKIFTY